MAEPVDSEETPAAIEVAEDAEKSDFERQREAWTSVYAESISESPGTEVTAEELLSAAEKSRSKKAAELAEAQGDSEEISNLQLDLLLAEIKKGQQFVASGQNLPGYGSTDQIVDKHAKGLGYTTEQYRELVNKYEIGLDGMINAAASTQKSPEDILNEYRQYNPYLGSEDERQAYKKRSKKRNR
jgi:hypothetical protein